MQVTLRKADQLAKVLKDLMSELVIDNHHNINVHDSDWRISLDLKTNEIKSMIENMISAQQALASIRRAIGQANFQAGINDLLAEDNMLKSKIAFLQQISMASPRDNDSTIQGMITQKKQPSESRYGYGNENLLGVQACNVDMIEQAKNMILEAKKRRREISDDLITKNVTAKVTLDSDVVAVLTKANLV